MATALSQAEGNEGALGGIAVNTGAGGVSFCINYSIYHGVPNPSL